MTRIEEWILDLKPPAYPAERIDAAKAAQGAAAYQRECASCHEVGGATTGQVTPLAEVGTDRERLDSFTAALAAGMNTIGEGKPWRFSHFRKTDGYANMPLDGIWLRAPYLHNGSVPTLRALLFPEHAPGRVLPRLRRLRLDERRLRLEWSRCRSAKACCSPPANAATATAATLYGASLDAAAKDALLEYLKTK